MENDCHMTVLQTISKRHVKAFAIADFVIILQRDSHISFHIFGSDFYVTET